MRSRIPGILFLFILVGTGVAAWLVLPHKERPVTTLILSTVPFSQLPGWSNVDMRAGLAAFRRSCQVILRAEPGTNLGAYAHRAGDWQRVCRLALAINEKAARNFFETNFSPFAVGGEALFTGYYEPVLHGSRRRHGPYQTPVYAPPRDLVSVDLGAFRPDWKGERIAGRLSAQRLIPYAARADIDEFPPPAAVLFYCDDPVSVFFLQIQGSGRVALDDGMIVRVAYAAQNGRRYRAIGAAMVRSGALKRQNLSLQSIRSWLRANPSAGRQLMETDESYVFFKEAPVGEASLGSPGTEGVALTPGASIAVDPRFHALGVPMFVDTKTGDGRALQGLVVAQDTGGAIRGPARADIFFGFGARAETLAGAMKSSGQLYVLLPKILADKVAR
jgi:membrane-bound lytic murein transglycosylase A